MEEKQEHVLHGPKLKEGYVSESLGKKIYRRLLECEQHVEIADGKSGKVVSSNQLLQTCCNLAETFKMRGYSKGCVVGIVSENNIFFACPLLASLCSGCTVALYSNNCTPDEMIRLTNLSRPSVIFSSVTAVNTLLTIRDQMTYLSEIVVIDATEDVGNVRSLNNYITKSFDPAKFEPVEVNPSEDVALIIFSSGTTGLPKGVMLTHQNMCASINMFSGPTYYTTREGVQEATILFFPFYHIFGLTMLFLNLSMGYSSIVLSKFDHWHYLKAVEDYRVSRLYILPSLIGLLSRPPPFRDCDVSSVQHILGGGAPISHSMEIDFKRRYPNFKHFQQMYGMSETVMLTTFAVNDSRTGSCGKLVPNMSGKVVDLDGRSLPSGRHGELCFKGDSIMKGYLGDPESTGLAMDASGWFSTGDLGYYDQDGYFYIIDRIKELIKYKGHQVAPAELEAVLLTHPKIKDAVVIGLPHELHGELPCAVIVTEGGSLSEKAVKDFVAAKLSPEKWLRGGVKFVPEIPRSPSGKILRRLLRDQYAAKSKL